MTAAKKQVEYEQARQRCKELFAKNRQEFIETVDGWIFYADKLIIKHGKEEYFRVLQGMLDHRRKELKAAYEIGVYSPK